MILLIYFQMSVPNRQSLSIGQSVWVVQKQDQGSGRRTRGVVQRVLTSSASHPFGLKVLLSGGVVGRVQALAAAEDIDGEGCSEIREAQDSVFHEAVLRAISKVEGNPHPGNVRVLRNGNEDEIERIIEIIGLGCSLKSDNEIDSEEVQLNYRRLCVAEAFQRCNRSVEDTIMMCIEMDTSDDKTAWDILLQDSSH